MLALRIGLMLSRLANKVLEIFPQVKKIHPNKEVKISCFIAIAYSRYC